METSTPCARCERGVVHECLYNSQTGKRTWRCRSCGTTKGFYDGTDFPPNAEGWLIPARLKRDGTLVLMDSLGTDLSDE